MPDMLCSTGRSKKSHLNVGTLKEMTDNTGPTTKHVILSPEVALGMEKGNHSMVPI